MKKILVLGAGGPAGVNFLHSVQSADYEFIGCDVSKNHIPFCEPFSKEQFVIPRINAKGRLKVINMISNDYEIDFIHAQPDPEVFWLSENRAKIHAETFLPHHDTIKICQDKFTSALMWSDESFPQCRPIFIDQAQQTRDLDYCFNRFGGGFWLRATEGAGGRASLFVKNKRIAKHWINFWFNHEKSIKFMAQEYLPGKNYAWMGLFDKGELLVSQLRERIEYIYPNLAVSGITGTPIIARTIHDSKAHTSALEAINIVDKSPNGIYCVDLKSDPMGVPIPTEINPGRFFTTSYFFARASFICDSPRANIPLMYLKTAFGESIEGIEPPLKKDVLPPNVYWFRHIDFGYRLMRKDGEKYLPLEDQK